MRRLVSIVARATLCLVPAAPVAAHGGVSVPFHGFTARPDGDLRHLSMVVR